MMQAIHSTIDRYKIIATSHVILFDTKKRVLLQKRSNTGYEDGNYSLIGGHVEQDETIIQAVIREAWEEIGVLLDEKKLIFTQVMHRRKESTEDFDRIDFFFSVDNFNGQFYAKEDKTEKLDWFDLNALPLNMSPYIRFVLENIETIYTQFGW